MYVLLDSGTTLSFMTLYVEKKFKILPECLLDLLSISTPIGETILTGGVYRDCNVSTYLRDALADLVELEMVDLM